MGKSWHIGHHYYTECDHCGLAYKPDSTMFDEHQTGGCVKIYGPAHNKQGGGFEFGTRTQAAARGTSGQQECFQQSGTNAPGSHVVGTPPTPFPERKVEKGFA